MNRNDTGEHDRAVMRDLTSPTMSSGFQSLTRVQVWLLAVLGLKLTAGQT